MQELQCTKGREFLYNFGPASVAWFVELYSYEHGSDLSTFEELQISTGYDLVCLDVDAVKILKTEIDKFLKAHEEAEDAKKKATE